MSYNWKKRYFADVVVNYSGSAYMPKGKRFHWYPAVSLGAIVLDGDPYLKVYASAGLSGSDGDLEHELWRQNYVSGNSYYFGANGGTGFSGRTEGPMAAVTLAPELSKKATAGIDLGLFGKRLMIQRGRLPGRPSQHPHRPVQHLGRDRRGRERAEHR